MRNYLLLITALLFYLPLSAQQKKKPLETPKPSVQKSRPAQAPANEPEAYAWLLVTTDLDVNISINFGKSYFVSTADEGRRLPLEKGDNVVKIIPVDGGTDGYTKEYQVTGNDNILLKVRLKAARDAEADRQAEKERKEEEYRLAEQKKKEDEARKAEAARVEEQKRKEEIQRAEEMRKAEQKRIEEEARLAQEAKKAEEARRLNQILEQIDSGMVHVKGGTFLMGCTGEQTDCQSDEKPTRQVTVSDFYIGDAEVTQALWRSVMGTDPSFFNGCDNCPVDRVSWDDIQLFLEKLNSVTGGTRYRLPTEAEWEYAARGGSQSLRYRYSGSKILAEVAWFKANCGSVTHQIKGRRPNELGLYDMSGNVSEWCSDWHSYHATGNQTNPKGPSTGTVRVFRGGSWGEDPNFCRVSFRGYDAPDIRRENLGFRLAKTP